MPTPSLSLRPFSLLKLDWHHSHTLLKQSTLTPRCNGPGPSRPSWFNTLNHPPLPCFSDGRKYYTGIELELCVTCCTFNLFNVLFYDLTVVSLSFSIHSPCSFFSFSFFPFSFFIHLFVLTPLDALRASQDNFVYRILTTPSPSPLTQEIQT